METMRALAVVLLVISAAEAMPAGSSDVSLRRTVHGGYRENFLPVFREESAKRKTETDGQPQDDFNPMDFLLSLLSPGCRDHIQKCIPQNPQIPSSCTASGENQATPTPTSTGNYASECCPVFDSLLNCTSSKPCDSDNYAKLYNAYLRRSAPVACSSERATYCGQAIMGCVQASMPRQAEQDCIAPAANGTSLALSPGCCAVADKVFECAAKKQDCFGIPIANITKALPIDKQKDGSCVYSITPSTLSSVLSALGIDALPSCEMAVSDCAQVASGISASGLDTVLGKCKDILLNLAPAGTFTEPFLSTECCDTLKAVLTCGQSIADCNKDSGNGNSTNVYPAMYTSLGCPLTATPSPPPSPTPAPTRSSAPSSPANNNQVCFPEHATVRLRDSSIKTMDKVNIGDKLVVGPHSVSEVHMFTHRLPSVVRPFLEVRHDVLKEPLVLTDSHYVYVNGGLRPARTIRAGDFVEVVLSSGKLEKSKVTSVSRVYAKGLYNPHTLAGALVVNGVRTSCYTEAVSPRLAHVLLGPLRALYQLARAAPDLSDGAPSLFQINLRFLGGRSVADLVRSSEK